MLLMQDKRNTFVYEAVWQVLERGGKAEKKGVVKRRQEKEHWYMKQIISNKREIPGQGQETRVLVLLCFKHCYLAMYLNSSESLGGALR